MTRLLFLPFCALVSLSLTWAAYRAVYAVVTMVGSLIP